MIARMTDYAEVIMTYFKVIEQHFSGRTKENHKRSR
jgi:hypothetical protein